MARRTKEQILASRKAVREAFGDALWDGVSAILADADPLGFIDMGAPRNEYDPEVETILPRLAECDSAADMREVVFQEFERWFGAGKVGPPDRYTEVAEEIWALWRQRA